MGAQGLADFIPHYYQQLALDSKARFIACVTGAQGGKTTIGAIWLLREIWESYQRGETGDWLIVVPSFKVYEQSTGVKMEAYFPEDWGHWREQRKCYDLAWGGKIFVRSADEPDSLEGITAKGGWIDEAGQIKNQAWINVQARLAVNKGRCIMTTTPYSFNWLYYDIVKRAASINGVKVEVGEPDPDIDLFQWESVDNPAFGREEYERLKRSLSPEMFARRHCGQFTRMEGLVYKEFDHDKHIVEWFPIPQEWKRFAGMDFGFTNATAIVCIAQSPEEKDGEGKIIKPSVFYVFREFYKSRPTLKQMAEFIEQEQLSFILGDPRAAQEINELQRHYGVKRIQAADNTKDIGIERVRQLIREDRLKFVGKRVPNLISEIEEYHYEAPNKEKNTVEKPVDVHNHAMDALRYAFSREMKGLYVPQAGYRKTRQTINHARYANSFTGYF